MVQTIRRLEQALGSGDKVPARSEIPVRTTGRRGLYARRAIAAGEVLAPDMISAMRPVAGIGVENIGAVLGKCVVQDLEKDEPITRDLFTDTRVPAFSRGENQ
jgi:N,N'-diacetyllegionaminate synthase